MSNLVVLEPVDYLVIGHVAHDLTPEGPRLGGTAAYSALTAQALGLRVGIVTASGPETSLDALNDIPVISLRSPQSTTFENIYRGRGHGRIQYLRAQAARIDFSSVPEAWRRTPIIHLGPIANETDSILPEGFSPVQLGLTPQGWMRQWDSESRVSLGEWTNADAALARAGAVVISREDVNGNDELIEHMSHQTRMLAVTEGAAGAVLYWNGDRRRFGAPEVTEVDATGAGDVFAAAFFVRLFNTHDPWEATRFATLVASRSVMRVGLDGIPTPREIEECMMEVLH
ncbi:MAG TPA: PfkB family carbohydrate kinase [Anaerolineales bacterium]|nr:PfkB family carbohydrate kinase [Anaerolineales bacterium]